MTRNARAVLESVRSEIRSIKWACGPDKPTVDPQRIFERLGSIADFITEHIDHLDDDILLRSSLDGANYLEVRVGDKMALTVEEFKLAMDMMALTGTSIERRRADRKKESSPASPPKEPDAEPAELPPTEQTA